jgi:hypothetical protein
MTYNDLAAKYFEGQKQETENRAAQAQAEAQRQAQQAEAERVQLQLRRQERLAREALTGLSPEERAEYDARTDPQTHILQMVQEARQKVEAETLAAIEANRDREFSEWRTKNPKPTQWELHQALQEIKGRAEESKQAFFKAREDRELQAEAFDSLADRALAMLDEKEKKLFAATFTEWSKRDPMADVQAAKRQLKQTELRKAYEVEVMKASTPAWKANVRAHFRGLGLDV